MKIFKRETEVIDIAMRDSGEIQNNKDCANMEEGKQAGNNLITACCFINQLALSP